MAILFQLLGPEDTAHWVEVRRDGQMILREHPDPELDVIAREMGFPSCGCTELLERWEDDPLGVLFQYLTAGTDEDVQSAWGPITIEWVEGWNDVVEHEMAHDPAFLNRYKHAIELTKTADDEPGRYFRDPGFKRDIEDTFRNLRGQSRPTSDVVMALAKAFDGLLIDDLVDALWGARATMEFLQNASKAIAERAIMLDTDDDSPYRWQRMEDAKREAAAREFNENMKVAIGRVEPISITQMRAL